MRNREGYIVTKEVRECTKCGNMFPNKSRVVTLCPTCNSSRVKGESPEVRMYRRSKARAKDRGIEFTIDKSDIIIPEVCPILGMLLVIKSGSSGGSDCSPALDRIDNSKGYEPGNLRWSSRKDNLNNRSVTLKVENYNGVIESLQDFCLRTNQNPLRLRQRYRGRKQLHASELA